MEEALKGKAFKICSWQIMPCLATYQSRTPISLRAFKVEIELVIGRKIEKYVPCFLNK